MFNIEQCLISFTQKTFALSIRLRCGFVTITILYAIFVFLGLLALLLSIAICLVLIFIGYSEAEKEEDKWDQFVEKSNESIKRVIEKIFHISDESTIIDSHKNTYISLIFFRSKKNDNQKIKYYLLYFAILFIIFQYTFEIFNYKLFFLIFFLVSFLVIKEQLLEYRISKGLFGTNPTEARDLIDFIIKNSDNLDFTDSNGNLRRALLPEAKDAVEEHIPGILGEEARA